MGLRAYQAAERQALLAQRRPPVKEVEKLEKQLAQWQPEKAQIDGRLADPGLYASGDKAELANLLKRQSELAALIEAAESRWLEVHEALEALQAADA